MNVFELRQKLIADYSSFVKGFITIKDEAIRKIVEEELSGGMLWPDPLVQLSPFFKLGESIDELITSGILHPDCAKVFRIKTDKSDLGISMKLYLHQSEAIKRAASNQNYVLTTGTGSGKSLSYIIPIVNHVLNSGSGKGIKAIIVYPMNALANSQEKELQKFVDFGFPSSAKPVSFKRYTGQESDEEKKRICTDPPDIILTNYVMLELILTRPDEAPLVKACQNLKFLVLDELHTYRGRQGADVAMLIRRAKEATKAKDIICVGTSATMSSTGDLVSQKQDISRMASLLFGSEVQPENVIGETLQRVTAVYDFNQPDTRNLLIDSISDTLKQTKLSFDQIKVNYLASWIENTFGLSTEDKYHTLSRSTPKSITGVGGGAGILSELTGLDIDTCARAIQHTLMLGYNTLNDMNGFPVFAFRLHQFISKGDTVYASLDEPEIKHLTLQRQLFVPNSNKGKILLPLAFCRHCGQEYYTVLKIFDEERNASRFLPRELNDRLVDPEQVAGFLYLQNPDPNENTDVLDKFPAEWKDQNGKVLYNRQEYLPRQVSIGPDGYESNSGLRMQFLNTPFRYCPNCGVSYAPSQHSDFGKLSSLGTEGRSTATTILSLSAIRHLRQMDIDDVAKKLLSFTDNRQDASLQAGHFNDFIRVGLLRGALYQALASNHKESNEGIRHSDLTQKVFNSLNLPYEEYASNPDAAKGMAKAETDRSLRNVLGYHLYHDLRRGWRVNAPNLEQTGLLEIDYLSVAELAADEEHWVACHPVLSQTNIATRMKVLKVLLDLMRRELAIKTPYLDPLEQDRLLLQSQQRLVPPWGFDENVQIRQLTQAAILYPRARRKGKEDFGNVFLSNRSGFAQYLRRSNTFADYPDKITVDETQTIIENLFSGLSSYGLIEKVKESRDDVPGYQLVADAILWKIGSGGSGYYDPIRQPSESMEGQPVNQFFKEFYQFVAFSAMGLESREHTAQVSYEEREKREEAFRKGTLPILYCSPTMELGIDISQLNVVNMRNMPPTPANYAQRSGRAGRSGQPALIFSYCSTGSPHDQYFFKRPANMVAGSVVTPQIDIANEDMLHSHINAIWLSEAGMKLGNTLTEVIDTSGESPRLELMPLVQNSLNDLGIKTRALKRAEGVIATIAVHLQNSIWYSPDWLSDVLNQIPLQFEQACERWRGLFKAALHQREFQHKIIIDASRNHSDKEQAKRLRREAESQLEILTSSKGAAQSDFYSYRYFASEGFLPGYNFPRLPLSAFIPGRRVKSGKDEYLSRPRFLAITEFGPRSFVYHEGSRYIINQVIMAAQDDQNGINTKEVKLCPGCGYLHLDRLADTCDHCKEQLHDTIPNLFLLQNVVAKRRDQINCDEEERLRLGFDVRTTLRFASRKGNLSCLKAEIIYAGKCIARLTYGDSATLWRINFGYKYKAPGFLLDTERGYWGKNDAEDSDNDSPMSKNLTRVSPYVSDTKNCLLFEPFIDVNDTIIASLQAALKNAIQQVFELEDNELAAEPLPSKDKRKSILFYEATEGGAGVLKQVIDASGFKRVIKAAIELCHFNSSNFEDQKRSRNAKEDCEAACYDCLLSYTNQTDHALLDRKAIIDILITLLSSELSRSSSDVSREDHYKSLKNLAGSDLETKWLDFIYKTGYILPTNAQQLIESCHTRPDFTYNDKYTAIYIDGPVHKDPHQQAKDKDINESLDDGGWLVIRFRYDDDWQAIISTYANVFGSKETKNG